MILRLAPQLVVGDVTEVPDVPFGRAFEPAHRAWVMPDRSVPGHIGLSATRDGREGRGPVQLVSRRRSSILLNRVVAWDGREWDV